MTNELIIYKLTEVDKNNNTAGWRLLRVLKILEHAVLLRRLEPEAVLVQWGDKVQPAG
jgi:hypothetical protein